MLGLMNRSVRSPSSLAPNSSLTRAYLQIHYPGDSWNDESANENLYGNLKALYLMKKKHRHLKSESALLKLRQPRLSLINLHPHSSPFVITQSCFPWVDGLTQPILLVRPRLSKEETPLLPRPSSCWKTTDSTGSMSIGERSLPFKEIFL